MGNSSSKRRDSGKSATYICPTTGDFLWVSSRNPPTNLTHQAPKRKDDAQVRVQHSPTSFPCKANDGRYSAPQDEYRAFPKRENTNPLDTTPSPVSPLTDCSSSNRGYEYPRRENTTPLVTKPSPVASSAGRSSSDREREYPDPAYRSRDFYATRKEKLANSGIQRTYHQRRPIVNGLTNKSYRSPLNEEGRCYKQPEPHHRAAAAAISTSRTHHAPDPSTEARARERCFKAPKRAITTGSPHSSSTTLVPSHHSSAPHKKTSNKTDPISKLPWAFFKGPKPEPVPGEKFPPPSIGSAEYGRYINIPRKPVPSHNRCGIDGRSGNRDSGEWMGSMLHRPRGKGYPHPEIIPRTASSGKGKGKVRGGGEEHLRDEGMRQEGRVMDTEGVGGEGMMKGDKLLRGKRIDGKALFQERVANVLRLGSMYDDEGVT
ncbi:hypothetical protein MMC12_006868 [Toensbergia leucococca]|nr:hypothetical protein [Toensbergia leucococca]